MPYLVRLKKNDRDFIRLASTAVEALVLIETYAAHGYVYSGVTEIGLDDEISLEDLTSRARQSCG